MRPHAAGGTVDTVDPATDDQMARFSEALTTLARGHGLSNLRLAGDGRLIADIAEGRTLLDVARFEIEAQTVLQARVSVISSRSELVRELAGRRSLLRRRRERPVAWRR